MSLRILLTALLLCLAGAVAAIDPLPFADETEETRFRELTAELRCVMCQNQSLADSNAGIAGDLRREIFDLMREGMSDAQIKTYLTERYGEFVLYRPRLNASTFLLWFGPALVLVAGAGVLFITLRRRAARLAGSDAGRGNDTDTAEDW
ncbi:MAG: cytochrome c-type biogenesis protein [Lysobacteraceae bacterium]